MNNLIGKNILVICTFLFAVVLILTSLTLLSYDETTIDQLNDLKDDQLSKNESKDDEFELIKQDKNLKDFLDTLNSLLTQNHVNTDDLKNQNLINSTNSSINSSTNSSTKSNNELNLDHDWQKNSLKISDSFAQKLIRGRILSDDDYDDLVRTPIKYRKIYNRYEDGRDMETRSYRDSINDRIREDNLNERSRHDIERENTYSDEDYYDKLNKDIIYGKHKFDYVQDSGGGDSIKYYLVRKENNKINLASEKEIKGLNELITLANSALISPNKYSNQLNNLAPSSSNLPHSSHQLPPSLNNPNFQLPPSIQDNFVPSESKNMDQWGQWGWSKKQIPYSQLTFKQRVKVNICEKMLKKVHLYPSTLLLPVYSSKNSWEWGGLK